MLNQHVIDALLAPITEGMPCGDNLEYEPAFIALESAAQRKPEQQFGDTVIPAIEPEWIRVQEQAIELLERSKDLRIAVLLLRASTHTQGLIGFVHGLRLMHLWLDSYWADIHPVLDAEDDNDPTMRLNALAPLADDTLLVRDAYDTVLGQARGIGSITIRDLAIARNALPAGASDYSASQVEGGIQDLLSLNPELLEAMQQLTPTLQQLQKVLEQHSQRSDAVDLSRLKGIAKLVSNLVTEVPALEDPNDDAQALSASPAILTSANPAANPAHGFAKHTISTRQEALQQLDKVIQFLEQTEPGNPAPLLIARAKKLIGVSFLDIINDLAPDAMGAIQQVTGIRHESD